jgi:hypothetical protein
MCHVINSFSLVNFYLRAEIGVEGQKHTNKSNKKTGNYNKALPAHCSRASPAQNPQNYYNFRTGDVQRMQTSDLKAEDDETFFLFFEIVFSFFVHRIPFANRL